MEELMRKHMITIAILNESTVLTDAQVQPVVAALQKQVTNDFCPAWGLAVPTLVFIPKGQAAPAGSWQLAVLDNSDQAGALGYHDVTAEDLPLGKVFAADDLKDGVSWSVTLSHELLEMLADPLINLTAVVQTAQKSGRIYAYEDCDAVESDSLGYQIDGILVSDFVLPSWFVPGAPAPYDHMKKITKPLELLPGGYISYLQFTSKKGWTQITADGTPGGKVAKPGSRRERRARGRHTWQKSTARRAV
jgi:hypothetical protein